MLREVESIDERSFRQQYLRTGEPVVIRRGALGWPSARWSWPQLEMLGEGCEVVCEVGDAMQGENARTTMSLAKYIAAIRKGGELSSDTYLAQFELFRSLPELRDHVDFSLFRSKRISRKLAWIGPAGTVTGLHCDHADNLVAQVIGRKTFSLAAPSARPNVYVSEKYDFFTDCSATARHDWDATRYPKLANVDWAEVVLEPGDMLFTPAGWWHEVRAIDDSVTVNMFGLTSLEAACEWREFTKHLLHALHLYRRGWCTCHTPSTTPRSPSREG